MTEERMLPKFESEAEEAQWWFDNQDRFDADFAKALAEGTLGRGSAMKQVLFLQQSVVPDSADALHAQRLAEKKGIPYQEFLKQLIHLGLEHAAEQAVRQAS